MGDSGRGCACGGSPAQPESQGIGGRAPSLGMRLGKQGWGGKARRPGNADFVKFGSTSDNDTETRCQALSVRCRDNDDV